MLVGFVQHLREQDRDGALVLAGLQRPVRKVFDVTSLGELFRVN
jgi:anti-anti-sigma regulatory factor